MKSNYLYFHTYVFFSEKTMVNQDIAGQGNCLLMETFGLAGINCFYEKLGYICESKGNCMSEIGYFISI